VIVRIQDSDKKRPENKHHDDDDDDDDVDDYDNELFAVNRG
jgi:hypothetical protein